MTIIEQVRREREDLARVLKKHSGIRRIVEDLYPDSAHFIYELLQNAEDTQATFAQFVLTESSLAYEHDGRPFETRDIEAITDIGEGTKAEDDDKIGRFGVGFKAVFAYSETPHIWSPTFSFKISDLVLPEQLDQRPTLKNKTRFEFPFNNPKKNSSTAFAEIQAGLSELLETTLLFLTHLKSISWKIGESGPGYIMRIQHSEFHLEVLKQAIGGAITSSHFLRFDRPVEGLEEKRRIATAFALEYLPGIEKFKLDERVAQQFRIAPALPGRVAVFFPAEKETSGLRFHLHAPFVPELSRASIKETPANLPLFDQLASLCADALHKIRDLGLLTVDFLAVLPNPQDTLSDRYKCIRESIVKEMKAEPLTPTHTRGHAAAKQLLQSKASLKDLLTTEDLRFLVEHNGEPYQWSISATQKNSNVDRFLEGLEIQNWHLEQFCEMLNERTADNAFLDAKTSQYGPDTEFMAWLSGQTLEWHQRLYALLHAEAGLSDHIDARIIRLSSGEYSDGSNCFFPSDDVDHDIGMPRVDRSVYSSGKSKVQQDNSRRFLEKAGVRHVGEAELIQALLEQRYKQKDHNPSRKDLERFVVLAENEPQRAKVFSHYLIFEAEDGKWHRPGDIFIDQPFTDSGLSLYYERIRTQPQCCALASWYINTAVSAKRIAKFVESVGGRTRLLVKRTCCTDNPQRDYLHSVSGERHTSPIDRDFTIEGLDMLLTSPSRGVSKLLWQTMASLSGESEHLQAIYQKNERWGARFADSQLVHHLRKAAWVPQSDGRFVRPAEADRDLLPEGFAYDVGWPWLKAIHFGQDEVKRVEARKSRQSQAQSLGFINAESLDRAQKFATLLAASEQERLIAEWEHKRDFRLPENEPSNAERRAERVKKQAIESPVRSFEKRARSVAVGREEIKEAAAQYLRQQYTNADGVMICQVCKLPLPFKLDDGAEYFEKVWFLRKFKKQHSQNYLALCPNHAAMFQYANGSSDELSECFGGMNGNYLGIILAQRDESIYFTKTHVADLKAVMESESAGDEEEYSQ